MIFRSSALAFFLLPMKLSSTMKARMKPDSAHVVQFGDELVRVLHARPTAEDHDDVAELALKRTSARELQRPGRVAIDLEQIVSRRGTLDMSVGCACS